VAIQLSPSELRRANMQARLDALEQQVEALQRHRFAVSVFLGLSFRKRFLWLLFGAKVFRPPKAGRKTGSDPVNQETVFLLWVVAAALVLAVLGWWHGDVPAFIHGLSL